MIRRDLTRFIHNKTQLVAAFAWNGTPQGYSYWCKYYAEGNEVFFLDLTFEDQCWVHAKWLELTTKKGK